VAKLSEGSIVIRPCQSVLSESLALSRAKNELDNVLWWYLAVRNVGCSEEDDTGKACSDVNIVERSLSNYTENLNESASSSCMVA